MATLTVQLGTRSYPIHINAGLLERTQLFSEYLHKHAVCIITDDNVAPLYLRKLERTLKEFAPEHLVLPHGEKHKDWRNLDSIFGFLLKRGLGRDAVLLALGGGVLGDLTGFAAACYQRGIDYIQVPTTLLAQVDSSVGGKTAINHKGGKNMIGAFHQPLAVITDINTLKTLPPRELHAGLAEVIKCGLIADEDFFLWLEAHVQEILELNTEACQHAIVRACEIKAAIVAEDEREQGRRALLNLGHTFGHAIETALGYGEWLHGEAVAAGIGMAAEMSVRMDWLKASEYRRICRLLERTGLPNRAPDTLRPMQILAQMRKDKKVRKGRLRMVLPRGIGEAVISEDIDPRLLGETLAGKPI
ncbi:MAG TPA: 3-dehydroquinate synthase [Gammaproteobacteria bacterium]|nr:3-dehydroquinate synthase [Gammaproteobacteria bacterium]